MLLYTFTSDSADTKSYMVFGADAIHSRAASSVHSPSLSFCVHFFQTISRNEFPFIGSAQHAIMGPRLTATHAGFAPARQ
jgi:hypothetical protein